MGLVFAASERHSTSHELRRRGCRPPFGDGRVACTSPDGAVTDEHALRSAVGVALDRGSQLVFR